MIKVVAKNRIKQGSMDEVLNMLDEMIELTRKEDGCIKYELFKNMNDSNVITFIEEWENMDKLNAHINSDHFKRIIPAVGKHAEEDIPVEVYEKIK